MPKYIVLPVLVFITMSLVSACTITGPTPTQELDTIQQDSLDLEKDVELDPLSDPDLTTESLPTDTDLESLEVEAEALLLEPESYQ